MVYIETGDNINFSHSSTFDNSAIANQLIFGASHAAPSPSMVGEPQFLKVFDSVITNKQLLAEANK